jgi:hypothetical protein
MFNKFSDWAEKSPARLAVFWTATIVVVGAAMIGFQAIFS